MPSKKSASGSHAAASSTKSDQRRPPKRRGGGLSITSVAEVLFDPMGLFCISCILTPLVVQRETLTSEMVWDYFTEPTTAACLMAVPLVTMLVALRQPSSVRLTFAERCRARWYLFNGLIIHMLMDGCVGVFKTNTLFAANYAKLDRRYGDVLGTPNGATVHVISLMELMVKGPLCVLLYAMFQWRHPARDALEFFTCVTQAYGTIVYLGQEAISGAPNLDVDYDLTFSMHHLLYFWFAIIFGCVLYLAVPMYLGWRSFRRLVHATAAQGSASGRR